MIHINGTWSQEGVLMAYSFRNIYVKFPLPLYTCIYSSIMWNSWHANFRINIAGI